MKISINVISKKEFSRLKEKNISYYQTPAGILEVFSNELGIYKAVFIDQEFVPKDIQFIDYNCFKLLLIGTEFQIKVWKKLLEVPLGKTVSYEDIAKQIWQPKAFRAVANAVGSNKIAYFIPCHRVIKKNKDICGYNWGKERKIVLLKSETLK